VKTAIAFLELLLISLSTAIGIKPLHWPIPAYEGEKKEVGISAQLGCITLPEYTPFHTVKRKKTTELLSVT